MPQRGQVAAWIQEITNRAAPATSQDSSDLLMQAAVLVNPGHDNPNPGSNSNDEEASSGDNVICLSTDGLKKIGYSLLLEGSSSDEVVNSGHHKLEDDLPERRSFVGPTDLEDEVYANYTKALSVASEDRAKQRRDQPIFSYHGLRKIDYVLVWEEDLSALANPTRADKSVAKSRAEQRRIFQRNLSIVGLEIDEETVVTTKKKIHYVKLFITWEAMCHYAQKLQLRVPLQLISKRESLSHWSQIQSEEEQTPPDIRRPRKKRWFHRMRKSLERLQPKKAKFTTAFTTSKLAGELRDSYTDAYFTQTQRHLVAFEILGTQAYGKPDENKVGIERLIDEGVYSCAYPLHEGSYELPEGSYKLSDLNPRQQLYAKWARWRNWHRSQPLDHVREYFGEKVAFYFAWLGIYTTWLLPASIVGILVFIYGWVSVSSDVPSTETCNSNQSFKMCPICDEKYGCGYWYLSEICLRTWLSYLFDHPGSVFYATFMSFWAVLFLEFWKRQSACLAHSWGVADYKDEEERPRPGYSVVCKSYKDNPVTGDREPYFPRYRKLPRIATGFCCILLMLTIVLLVIGAVILFRTMISISLFSDPYFRSNATMIASVSGTLIHLVFLSILETVYGKLANKLTQWEMHRTQAEFEDNLTLKMFIFQMFNYYSSIFYIAFFKGKFYGYPGNYTTLFGQRTENCESGGCLLGLAVSLILIMIGMQVIDDCKELAIPAIKTRMHLFLKGLPATVTDHQSLKPWELDYRQIEHNGLFSEYLESVLQFGFITIFVAAFPLAPLFALLNNWVEIRLDARKLVCKSRRPLAERAPGIGIWFPLLNFIAQLAVISNAFLIAFTSEFLPKLVYKFQYRYDMLGYVNFTLSLSPYNSTSEPCFYKDFRDSDGNLTSVYWTLLAVRLAFVIAFEHAIFMMTYVLRIFISDMPKELRLKIKREQYLARQAFVDGELKLRDQRATTFQGTSEV